MRKVLIALGLLFSVSAFAQTESANQAATVTKPEAIYQEGTHYRVLPQPVPTSDPSRIEVVEVFSYHCGHCFNFEPLLLNWKAKLPSDVHFVQNHAVWNPAMQNLARGYYTGIVLKISDKAHIAAFNAIHIDRKPLNTADQWGEFFAKFGVEKDVAVKTFNSLGVTNMVSQAESRARNYKITGTPELVVEGKYGISSNNASSHADMLAITDYLIRLARYERSQKAKAN